MLKMLFIRVKYEYDFSERGLNYARLNLLGTLKHVKTVSVYFFPSDLSCEKHEDRR